jgi:arsenate reductase
MTITIWHNPRCSKSRQTLALLRDKGIEPEVVEYLKTPPDAVELKAVLHKLGIGPRDLLRKGEAAYKARGLSNTSLSDDALIQAMAEEPILIERPVVIAGDKAALGRPPEAVLAIV